MISKSELLETFEVNSYIPKTIMDGKLWENAPQEKQETQSESQ